MSVLKTGDNDPEFRQRICNAMNILMWTKKVDPRSSYSPLKYQGKWCVAMWVQDKFCTNELCLYYKQYIHDENLCQHYSPQKTLDGIYYADAKDIIADAGKLSLVDGKTDSL